jgi:hypothetical protein
MISSNDSYSDSDSDHSLLTSSSYSSDTDDEIDLNKWTATPAVNRDPFLFVGSRELQVRGAQTPIGFWSYIFPRDLVPRSMDTESVYDRLLPYTAS